MLTGCLCLSTVIDMRVTAPRERITPPQVSLRILREAHGLTLAALALRIQEQGVKVTADHLSNVELGWKRPSNHLLHAWAKALQITRLDIQTPESDEKDAAA